jgi:hypothetical protein
MWIVLLTAKLEASSAIKRIQAAAEKKCGRKLRVLRTDNGGEFTAAKFATYCDDEGVTRHFSAPYTPQQNGVVQRRNQTVVAMARALLKQRRMPVEFWGEAVVTAVYLQNRLPTKSLADRTPYVAWHGRKLAVNHLCVFGSATSTSSPTGVAPGSSSATLRVQRCIASLIRRLGRRARRVTPCLMRRVAGTGPKPRACHQRQTHRRIHLCRGIGSSSGG